MSDQLARASWLGIGAAGLVMLLGCTASGEGGRDGAAPADAASQTAAADVAWEADLDVLGQPVEAGPALLVLVKAEDAVRLVSVDKESGKRNFSMPFHPGGLPPGVAMTPRATQTDDGAHLALVRRREPGAAGPALVAVDVRTGAEVRRTQSAVDDYDACSDGSDVCWSGYPMRLGGFIDSPFGRIRDVIRGGAPVRWDLEAGRTSEKTLQEGAIKVGDPDLFVSGEGRLAMLSHLPGTRRTDWSVSVVTAVASGVDPKAGWRFSHDEQEDVYVGSLGMPPPQDTARRYRQGKEVTTDLADSFVTAGIDGDTGRQLWRREGADAWCPLIRTSAGTEARTLCVIEGSRFDRRGKKSTYQDLVVELQGVDPRSGEIAWTYAIEGEDAERVYADGQVPLAPYGVVVPSDDGPVALDQRSGDTTPVSDGSVLLCAAGPDRLTVYGARRTAGTLYRTCDPTGAAVDGEVSSFGISAIGGDGEMRYVGMKGRLVAYRLG